MIDVSSAAKKTEAQSESMITTVCTVVRVASGSVGGAFWGGGGGGATFSSSPSMLVDSGVCSWRDMIGDGMPQSRWTLDGFRLLLFIHFIARPAFLTKGGDGGLKITQTAKDENCPTSMSVTKDKHVQLYWIGSRRLIEPSLQHLLSNSAGVIRGFHLLRAYKYWYEFIRSLIPEQSTRFQGPKKD
jgi:hypothetical protein